MRYPDWNGEIPPLFKPTTLAEFRAKLVPRVNNSDSGSTHNVEDTKQGDIGSGTVNHGGLSKGGIVAIVLAFVIFVVFVAVVVLWLRRRHRTVRPKKQWASKDRDIEMTNKEFERNEDVRRRDEEEVGSGAPPPTYQAAAIQK